MKHLHKLLADNKGRGQFRAEATADEATIYLYDTIVSDADTAAWYGGVDPLTFAKALAGIDAPIIHLRINSPGGDVFAAQAMAQALREHNAKVIAHIDGYAASAATEVAVAADEVIMAPGAMYMIHNAWTIAIGNKNDLIDTAALLEKVDTTLAEAYAQRSGADIQQVRDWMDAETWFSAQEAVDAGFADSVAEPKNKASASTKWDLSAYTHAPKQETKASTESRAEAERLDKLVEEAWARLTAKGIGTSSGDAAADPAAPAFASHDHDARKRRLALATQTA